MKIGLFGSHEKRVEAIDFCRSCFNFLFFNDCIFPYIIVAKSYINWNIKQRLANARTLQALKRPKLRSDLTAFDDQSCIYTPGVYI